MDKNNLAEEIKKMPYLFICNFAEAVLMYIGKKTFEIASLQSVSEILPPISRGSEVIDPRISYLHIAGFATGKSTCASLIEKFAFYPLRRKDISANDLQMRAIQMEILHIIIDDFSQFCSGTEGYERVKILEGILGEEASILKSNMKVEMTSKAYGIGSIFGTNVDLERYARQIEGGLLSRCILNVIFLSAKEHADIGKFINGSAGDNQFSEEMKLKEQTIIDYYQKLKNIQLGNDEKIKPIVNYHIEQRFKDEMYDKWKKLSDKLIEELGEKSYIRDLNIYYKFLVCSAFLNVYNRKLEEVEVGRDEEGKIKKGNILYPNEEDHRLAMKLMIQTMRHKWALDKAMFYKKNVKTLEMFKSILQNEKISEVKNILLIISPYARLIKDTKIF